MNKKQFDTYFLLNFLLISFPPLWRGRKSWTRFLIAYLFRPPSFVFIYVVYGGKIVLWSVISTLLFHLRERFHPLIDFNWSWMNKSEPKTKYIRDLINFSTWKSKMLILQKTPMYYLLDHLIKLIYEMYLLTKWRR